MELAKAFKLGRWSAAALQSSPGTFIGLQAANLTFGPLLDLNETSEALELVPGFGRALSHLAASGGLADLALVITDAVKGDWGVLYTAESPVMRGVMRALRALQLEDPDDLVRLAQRGAEALGERWSANALASTAAGSWARWLLAGSRALEPSAEWAGQALAFAITGDMQALQNALSAAEEEALGWLGPERELAFYNRFGQLALAIAGMLPIELFQGELWWQAWESPLGWSQEFYHFEAYWNRLGFLVISLRSPRGVPLLSERKVTYGCDLLATVQWFDDLRGWHIFPLGLNEPQVEHTIDPRALSDRVGLFVFYAIEESLERGLIRTAKPAWATSRAGNESASESS